MTKKNVSEKKQRNTLLRSGNFVKFKNNYGLRYNNHSFSLKSKYKLVSLYKYEEFRNTMLWILLDEKKREIVYDMGHYTNYKIVSINESGI